MLNDSKFPNVIPLLIVIYTDQSLHALYQVSRSSPPESGFGFCKE